MLFQENTYSVLLVSVSRKTISETLPLLPATDYYPVLSARSVSEAKRMLIDESFDLVIINAPLPDDAGLQFATDLCVNSDAGVMLMVPKDLYEDTCSKVLPFGVVTLSIPTSTQMVSHSLRVLCSIRDRLRSVKTRQKTVEEPHALLSGVEGLVVVGWLVDGAEVGEARGGVDGGAHQAGKDVDLRGKTYTHAEVPMLQPEEVPSETKVVAAQGGRGVHLVVVHGHRRAAEGTLRPSAYADAHATEQTMDGGREVELEGFLLVLHAHLLRAALAFDGAGEVVARDASVAQGGEVVALHPCLLGLDGLQQQQGAVATGFEDEHLQVQSVAAGIGKPQAAVVVAVQVETLRGGVDVDAVQVGEAGGNVEHTAADGHVLQRHPQRVGLRQAAVDGGLAADLVIK